MYHGLEINSKDIYTHDMEMLSNHQMPKFATLVMLVDMARIAGNVCGIKCSTELVGDEGSDTDKQTELALSLSSILFSSSQDV